jgi:hypothetical protein
MSTATDILGKIGQKVGTQIKTVSDVATQASDDLTTHTNDANNPHSVTKSQIGLSDVENTALSTFTGSENITTLGTIATGTVPYNLLSGAPNPNQIDGDLNISGNLQVNGTRTILQTQTLQVEDNIIELNLKSDGSETAQTAGIEINRGAGTPITANTGFTGTLPFTPGNDNGTVYGDFGGAYDATGYSIYSHSDTFHLVNLSAGTYDTVASDKNDIMNTLNDGWVITNVVKASNRVTSFDLEFTGMTSALQDKAKIIWDDTTSKFRLKVGSAASDLVVDKIYNNNMFAAIGDLPSATQYHGMMAHVHATGQSYFAHDGSWVELISVSGGQTISGNLVLTGGVTANSFAAPDANGFTINGTPLGDYATFESAFNTAIA